MFNQLANGCGDFTSGSLTSVSNVECVFTVFPNHWVHCSAISVRQTEFIVVNIRSSALFLERKVLKSVSRLLISAFKPLKQQNRQCRSWTIDPGKPAPVLPPQLSRGGEDEDDSLGYT